VTISWETPAGTQAGIYNSAYVGASSAILASLFLSFIGFYLVAGSVRRDRERKVGAILAATPISKTAYLGGKLAAHVVYLAALALVALATGVLVFARYGTGQLSLGDFLLPYALLVLPAMIFVAVLAVLFDATPGLRGRAGLLLFFYVWAFGLLIVPVQLHGGFEQERRVEGPALYDPLGLATFVRLVSDSVVGVRPGGIAIGYHITDAPIERVAWPGVRWSAAQVAARVATLGWAAPFFALAVLVFDRFDPARRRGGRRRAPGEHTATAPQVSPTFAVEAGSVPRPAWAPATIRPRASQATLAEARLGFRAAGRLRWLLPLAGLLAASPGNAGKIGTATLLLLLAPAISEIAARERLQGTAALVFSQPGLPASRVLWKAAAVALLVLTLGLPRLLATAMTSPARSLSFLLGLVFVVTFAVGAGALSGGGKLFTGFYVALWYLAVNGGPALDWSGAFAAAPQLRIAAAFAAAGATLLALAVGVEKRSGRQSAAAGAA
jgi:hypothetical protein